MNRYIVTDHSSDDEATPGRDAAAWSCASCTMLNDIELWECSMCHAKRPASTGTPTASRAVARSGTWSDMTDLVGGTEGGGEAEGVALDDDAIIDGVDQVRREERRLIRRVSVQCMQCVLCVSPTVCCAVYCVMRAIANASVACFLFSSCGGGSGR